MRELQGRVAVVTGAASGIGRALAERFGAEGMRVVLADVEEAPLARVAQSLGDAGVEALAVPTDVADASAVDALAARTRSAFGAVHVVCNNAGVFAGGPSWEASLEDYAWVLGVNTWGVIHGIRSFVPWLIEQGEDAHVVNTASMAAVTSAPFSGAYTMSKHAVLALSECLYHELRLKQAPVGVSVLCPELVATGIADAERNRPADLPAPPTRSPERLLTEQAIRAGTQQQGLAPALMADRVLDAIREDRFYILSDEGWRRAAETRLDDVRAARNPTFAIPGADGGAS